mmetsp:Transcript_4126/g.619  ORF Transcript_4126/g.619 Transcript_4126/m.619 type:complete len:92 (-) Transcript_4126:5-280(-)
MSLVDVRDVAEVALQAILKNASGRYLAVEKGYTFEEITEMIRVSAGEFASNVPTKRDEGEKAVPTLFDLADSVELIGRPFTPAAQSLKDCI